MQFPNARPEGVNNKIGILSYRAFGFHSATPLIATIYRPESMRTSSARRPTNSLPPNVPRAMAHAESFSSGASASPPGEETGAGEEAPIVVIEICRRLRTLWSDRTLCAMDREW